jgi:putative Mg2+ transporter-C (MgtC) family protein
MDGLKWLALNSDSWEMVIRMVAAVAVGAFIGGERSYHGRPAGFRTHALVCTASSLLMLITAYESYWVRSSADIVKLDPTRMAQGIMTGIGFLGAGVILKEGLSVRGLTTAASVWTTAALGILAGIGFYFPLLVGTILTILILSMLHWIEMRMPTQSYYNFEAWLVRPSSMDERELFALIEKHGFSVAGVSHRFERESGLRRYNMTLRSDNRGCASHLVEELEGVQRIEAFKLEPAGKLEPVVGQ